MHASAPTLRDDAGRIRSISRGRRARHEFWIAVIGLAVLGAILAIAFRAYLDPAMMIDLANLPLCA